MRIEVNVEKKYFFGIMLVGLVLIGIAGVVAYYSDAGDPSIMGHSVDEMDWDSAINSNVTAAGYCIGNDTYKSCIQSWPSGSGATTGVSKIIAGSGIAISGGAVICAEGVGCSATGDVMINATATGGGGSGITGTVSLTGCHWVGSARCESCRKNWECPAGEVAVGIGGTSTGERHVDYLYVECCKLTIS